MPVADPKWVEKVITLAAKTISKKKIVIGVPTYGYEYDVTPLSEGYRYDLLWAFNPQYALELGQRIGVTPQRNIAGELSFSYAAASAAALLAGERDTTESNNANLATTTFSLAPSSNAMSTSTPFRLVWWSDASAIKDKIALAKKLGVRGIAIFKIDGGEDPAMWEVLSGEVGGTKKN